MKPELTQWIPQEHLEVFAARDRILESRAGWEKRSEILEDLAKRLKSFGSAQPAVLAPLTAQALPTDEIERVLQELELELERLQSTQNELGQCESEIVLAQSRKRAQVVGSVILVLALLLLVYLLI